MVIVVVGVKDKIQPPAFLFQRLHDGSGFGGVYACGQPADGIMNQIAVVIRKAGNLLYLKSGRHGSGLVVAADQGV